CRIPTTCLAEQIGGAWMSPLETQAMTLSNTAFRIATALLISGAVLPATAQQPLTAKARAAKFGLSDIRGIAYHPGPPLRKCASTVKHECETENGSPVKLPVDPKFANYALPFFLDSIKTYDPQGNFVHALEQRYTIYYDSDFYNEDFQALWGKAEGSNTWRRNDLGRFQQELQANFVHLYDWNADEAKRKHISFLNYARDLGMRVTIPISNETLRI